MFLASLTRPLTRPISRLPKRLVPPRTYSTGPEIDNELRNLLEKEKQSQSDPAVRSELDAFLNAPPPKMPSADPSPDDLEWAGRPASDISFASILSPEQMASTSKELFGTQATVTLQTLPNGFNTRHLPLPGPLPKDATEVEHAATHVPGRSIHRPFRHPRTHGLPAATIQFRSHDILSMHLFVHFATHAAYSLGIPCSGMFTLPTQRTLWTVPKGPFAHKKAQENFERKVHRRGLKAYDTDPVVVDLWFKYLRRHAMGGVGMRCVKWERMPLDVGQKAVKDVRDRLNRGRQVETTRSKIKDLGDKIVRREMGLDKTPTKIKLNTVDP